MATHSRILAMGSQWVRHNWATVTFSLSLLPAPPRKPLHVGYIMWNARLDESQAGIKIAWRNSNNLGYAGDTTLIAESEEKLKSFLMRVKEETEKLAWDTTFRNWDNGPITSWQVKGGGELEAVTDFIFLSSKITVDVDCNHEIKRLFLLRRKV